MIIDSCKAIDTMNLTTLQVYYILELTLFCDDYAFSCLKIDIREGDAGSLAVIWLTFICTSSCFYFISPPTSTKYIVLSL